MLSGKFIDIITAMKGGAKIEIINGLGRCGGTHLTKKDISFLFGNKLIYRIGFIGKYGAEYSLSEIGVSVDLTKL